MSAIVRADVRLSGGNPLVSICVPILNLLPYVDERMETILSQTYWNLEIIVRDSYSDDGTWERIQHYAQFDPRIDAKQIPRDGLYQALNRTIASARGKWIYIAMGDDTMTPDCIELMISGVNHEPSARIVHSGLRVIGESGEQIEPRWEARPAPRFMRSHNDVRHLRAAPFDGICGMAFFGAWTSLTQLLIRADVFDQTGYFPTKYGPFGDLAWGIKAGLIFDTVHVPFFLATWRKHPGQASQKDRFQKARATGELAAIVDEAMRFLAKAFPFRYRQVRRLGARYVAAGDWLRSANGFRRISAFLSLALQHPMVLLRYRTLGSPFYRLETLAEEVRRDLTSLGVGIEEQRLDP